MTAVTDWTDAIAHLRRADPQLHPLIDTHGHPDIAPQRRLVYSLARAIVSQQLSGAAARTIFGRVLALYGNRFPKPDAILATSDRDLRAAGLSGAKTAAFKDLARHVAERRLVPARLLAADDATVSETLLPIRGIGPWSVDMFLMFALARPDVLPVGDLGVRKGMQRHFRLRALPDPDRMLRLAAPWRPFRTAASWYMWRLLG